jgi:hypothetical protein
MGLVEVGYRVFISASILPVVDRRVLLSRVRCFDDGVRRRDRIGSQWRSGAVFHHEASTPNRNLVHNMRSGAVLPS